MSNPDAQFRRRAIETMESYANTTNERLDKTEATVARTAESVDRLVEAIAAQSQSIGRLERGIAQMVDESAAQRERIDRAIDAQTDNIDRMIAAQREGIDRMIGEGRAQRELMNNLIKLATAAIEQRAS